MFICSVSYSMMDLLEQLELEVSLGGLPVLSNPAGLSDISLAIIICTHGPLGSPRNKASGGRLR